MSTSVEIPLTQGKIAIVSVSDLPLLAGYRWHAVKVSAAGDFYAATANKLGKRIYMHRLLTGAPKGKDVDHINGVSLDNRRENLRVCEHRQNQANQRKQSRKTSSRFKGVTTQRNRKSKPWMAQIKANKIRHYLGWFATEEEAAKAYNIAATRLFGDFARLNKLD